MNRLTKSTLVLACVGVLACSGGDNDDSDTGDEPCNITQVDVFPAPNETRAYYRTTVEAIFKPESDENASLVVTDASGATVAGSTAWRGNALVFTADTPFAPSTSYNTAVDYACTNGDEKSIDASWTTSEVGDSVEASGLPGKAYALDLANARFVKPEGIGALLGTYLTVPILAGIESIDGTDIKMVGAIGEEDVDPPVQASCQPTIDFPTADFSQNPFFEVAGDSFEINVDEYSVTLEDFALSGSFAPDSSYIDGVMLMGSIDTRPLVGLLGDEEATPDAICVLAGSLGISCVECSDGSGAFCLDLVADSISAPVIDGAITVIEDPCLLEECADVCP